MTSMSRSASRLGEERIPLSFKVVMEPELGASRPAGTTGDDFRANRMVGRRPSGGRWRGAGAAAAAPACVHASAARARRTRLARKALDALRETARTCAAHPCPRTRPRPRPRPRA